MRPGLDRPIDEAKVERYIKYTRWIWIVATSVSLLGTVAALLMSTDTVVMIMLVVTLVQASIAIPAVITLPDRRGWARMIILVLGALSLGAISSAFRMQAWPSLVLNFALATTFAMMLDVDVKAAFRAAKQRPTIPEQPWPVSPQ